jgi:hypothetical protein
MLAVAFIAMAAATAIDAPRALAECCGFGIGNSSPCTFRVTIVLPTGERVVSVPPGGGSWTIPDCVPFRLKVTDVCGVEHYLPAVIGECITVSFGPLCCITICKVTECRWEAHQTHCIPPCP